MKEMMINWINSPLISKSLCLSVIFIVLLWPISAITDLIETRYQNEKTAIHQIQKNRPTQQKVGGPLLVLRYHSGAESKSQWRIIQPESVYFDSVLTTQPRQLGIYSAHLFETNTQIKGQFVLSQYTDLLNYKGMNLQDAQVIVLLAGGSNNPMGGVLPTLKLDQTEYRFHLGRRTDASIEALPHGLTATIDSQQLLTSQPIDFSLSLTLTGSQSFEMIPMADNSYLSMTGNWPHPGFSDGILPIQHHVKKEGFSSQWQSHWLAESVLNYLSKIETEGWKNSSLSGLPAFSIALKEPVSQYTMNTRTVKYAVLFIALTFSMFLLCEILFKLKVHVVNYGLIGFSLVTFFLLLLALSEHIHFIIAYLIAAIACITQISYYVAALMKTTQAGLWSAFGFSLLYLALLGILQAEDYALLLGSLFVFAMLSAIMLLTKEINWDRLSSPQFKGKD